VRILKIGWGKILSKLSFFKLIKIVKKPFVLSENAILNRHIFTTIDEDLTCSDCLLPVQYRPSQIIEKLILIYQNLLCIIIV
jgi:hypothetical protein